MITRCPSFRGLVLSFALWGHVSLTLANPCVRQSSTLAPGSANPTGTVSPSGSKPGDGTSNPVPTVVTNPAGPDDGPHDGPHDGPRVFSLNITWETRAPDGNAREMFLVNGQFPGPTLDINEGDDVIINVQNDSPFDTTIHFHGIEQYQTPWSDGVPGITQRPISPGDSFVYTWTATQYGSYWYHSHEIGQINDGLFGPIVIHPADEQETPFSLISQDPATLSAIQDAVNDVQPLMLSDWQIHPSPELQAFVVKSGIMDVCYDSILFNGKGNVNCWDQAKIQASTTPAQTNALAKANLTSLTAKGCFPASLVSLLAPTVAKDFSAIPSDVYDVCTPTTGSRYVVDVVKDSEQQWLALDLIATFGVLSISFSIDNHPMYIYAVDGGFVEPILVDAIAMESGSRYSVLIQIKDLGAFDIRAASIEAGQSIAASATLSIHEEGQAAPDTASVAYITDVGTNTTADVTFFAQSQQKSFPASPVSQTADSTFVLSMIVAGETYLWALNNSVYPLTHEADVPVLFDPKPFVSNNVTLSTLNGTWVDVVFLTATFPQPPHPIHKHGNKMYLIGEGSGSFPYATVADAIKAIPGSFNLVDPPRRDTLTTAGTSTAPAWMAIRYYSADPGAWFLHCHIQPHLDGGMSVVVQDGVDHWPEVPGEYLNYGA